MGETMPPLPEVISSLVSANVFPTIDSSQIRDLRHAATVLLYRV